MSDVAKESQASLHYHVGKHGHPDTFVICRFTHKNGLSVVLCTAEWQHKSECEWSKVGCDAKRQRCRDGCATLETGP